MAGDDVKVKALYKALKVLECFSLENPELGITEISEMLGLYKSNVHNIIATFEAAGYVDKNPHNGKYRLGMKILGLANIINANLSLRELVLPYMKEIATQARETVYLAVPYNCEVLYLESSYPQDILPVRSMLGVKAPMYCTGIGKAILAFSAPEKIEQVLAGGLKRFTKDTITDRGKLLEELAGIRERGYAVDNMEHELGIKCVGMPVNKAGQVVAGISISGPSPRFDAMKVVNFAQILKDNLKALEAKI